MKKKLLLSAAVGGVVLIILFCEITPKFSYNIVQQGGEAPAYFSQESDLWCGPACIQMYECFKTSSCPTQTEIMSRADTQYPYGILDDAEICSYMNNYIQWGKFADYRKAFSDFLSIAKSLVASDEPFIVWTQKSSIGHWILVVGYRIPFNDPYSDPVGIVFADPAQTCKSGSSCYGVYYDLSSSSFREMTGSTVGFIGMSLVPLKKDSSTVTSEDQKVDLDLRRSNQYANYKKNPGPDENSIPFADGSNGIPDTMDCRIMRAADSVVAVWGPQELVGFDPGYADQFDGAFACLPEEVTNMASLRTDDIPGSYWIVPYLHRSGNYYVGEAMVKLSSDGATFLGAGIAGFVFSPSAVEDLGQSPQANKRSVGAGLVTRQELHRQFPDCTFFPFWDNNEVTGVPMLPFWYIQRPDGSRFILGPWGQEMVRDAQAGMLWLKNSTKHYGNVNVPMPEKLSLSQNYPNPFNPETQINFAVPNFAPVKIEIFNVLGQRIKTLVNGEYQAGQYRVVWDGTDQNGEKVSSGIYMYRLQVDSQTESRKMILAK